jgi:hypothetical protein
MTCTDCVTADGTKCTAPDIKPETDVSKLLEDDGPLWLCGAGCRAAAGCEGDACREMTHIYEKDDNSHQFYKCMMIPVFDHVDEGDVTKKEIK